MKRVLYITAAVLSAFALGACSDSMSSTTGTLSVQLTDAPFPFSNVKSADMYVVRIDARMSNATDADVTDPTDPGNNTDPTKGWVTIATPNASYNLLDLQNGATVNLGQTTLPTGQYQSFRLILDVSKSSITLADGTQAAITWPSAGQTGVKINLAQPIDVVAGGTVMVLDFDLGNSFVLRGSSIAANGLLFKPVIRATARDITGSVSGSVHEDSPTGAPEVGATVEVLKAGTLLTDTSPDSVVSTTQTDDAGNFTFAFVLPGAYELRATPASTSLYQPSLLSGVTVTSGTDVSGNVIVVTK
ncbi:MAG TPA: DUF4382 domain-containing protein [Gemmatimonadaceae bacterium]|nr:DUF4382 domain-containing protein [Gemmatimonadaceae bacterium]